MRRAAVLAVGLMTAGCAATTLPAPGAPPLSGYLDAAVIQTIGADVAPAPLDLAAEQAAFRSVEPGSDRWQLAIVHAELRPPEAAQHFDCLLGTRLAQQPRPALTRLMTRLLIDSAAVTRVLAERAPRSRPIVEQADLQPCVRMDATSRNSPSWPASGAVVGAAYGEMFAALAPDRAEAARRRGLDIGLSRALCRVNWQADVDDGARIGRQVYEQAAAASGFAADLEAARSELVAARAEGLTNPGCAAERRALRGAAD